MVQIVRFDRKILLFRYYRCYWLENDYCMLQFIFSDFERYYFPEVSGTKIAKAHGSMDRHYDNNKKRFINNRRKLQSHVSPLFRYGIVGPSRTDFD